MSDFLSFRRVSFSHTGSVKPLFSGLTAQFPSGWTAITGPNGGGKTTFLKLACGVLAPDSGSIRLPSGSLLYCEQNAVLPCGWETVFWSPDTHIRKIFSLLRVADDFPLRWETLSGGEKKRLQVGLALCAQPAVLALDEPTNHLDADSSRVIADTLREYGGIGLLVSHSRALMDSLCPRTFYISPMEQALYSCPVSEALALREENRKAAQNEWHNAQTAVKNAQRQVQSWTEETSKTAARMSKALIDKKDRDSRAKINLARLTGKDAVAANTKSRLGSKLAHNKAKLAAVEKPLRRKSGVTLEGGRLERDILVSLPAGILYPVGFEKNADSEVWNKPVSSRGAADSGVPCDINNLAVERDGSSDIYGLSVPDLLITPSSRIALCGVNGSGKTLLIRHILRALSYDASGASPVTQNGLVYIPQEIPSVLARSYITGFFELPDAQKGAVLSRIYRLGSEPLSFLPQNVENSAVLSPGELRKLVISLALQTESSFLILDEPTNHLDLDSVILLETALREADCALLLCSHDDYFVRALTNEIWKTERTGPAGGRLITAC